MNDRPAMVGQEDPSGGSRTVHDMPQAPQQNIPQNLQRRIRVNTFDNVTGLENSDTWATTPSPVPSIATHAVDATDPHVVVITPGTSAGVVNLVVNKSPSCPDPLIIPVAVTAPANIGHVDFDSVITPDVPKP